jgi:hypothetical protein
MVWLDGAGPAARLLQLATPNGYRNILAPIEHFLSPE